MKVHLGEKSKTLTGLGEKSKSMVDLGSRHIESPFPSFAESNFGRYHTDRNFNLPSSFMDLGQQIETHNSMLSDDVTVYINNKERSANYTLPQIVDLDLQLHRLGFVAVSKPIRLLPSQKNAYKRKNIELSIWNYSKRHLRKALPFHPLISDVILDFFIP